MSILEGTDPIIDRWLGLSDSNRSARYKTRTALLHLVDPKTPKPKNGRDLIKDLLDQINENWKRFDGRYPSKNRSQQNWRYEKQTVIAPTNTSPEKTLEKTIAVITGDEWMNQVPTCSGLVGSGETHRNLDLVYRHPDRKTYSFIELKMTSDHPLFAAMEVLKYGLIYVFWRQHHEELSELGFPIQDRELLGARQIILAVLAPHAYYKDGDLKWLASEINTGLKCCLQGTSLGLKMSFQFEEFPANFSWLPSSKTLAKALQARTLVYQ